MNWNEATRGGLEVALNEADLVDVHVDPVSRTATVSLLVMNLAADRGVRAVQLLLTPVARVAASLRLGLWNDRTAAVSRFGIEALPATVRSFGGQPIHGFEFFDVHERELACWGDRLSLDWRLAGAPPARHSIALFQEGLDRHLDLCLWFDDLEVLDDRGLRIDVDAFIAAGADWWRAFRRNDRRTLGHGLFPL